jgi:hypothetical protein
MADHPEAQPAVNIARDGLPPVIFWAGAGATVLFGGASIALALYTKGVHEDFVDSGCERAAFAGCDDQSRKGRTAQIVTDAAFGATALAGVATIVVGVAFTDWRGHAERDVGRARSATPRSAAGAAAPTVAPVVAPVSGGAVAGWAGRF